ncbi:hypothetical protein BKA82DRAFT_815609 [Pisolithus tinctorius]|uniref:Uncharacterized protein n=1 Tax=Pisolithus tinctorius Marx 270 TaxID=870435 RepID=A0A0C3NDX4_PISTI|nr:hypothetical protein BKA82DRAFT_815609 [Pisolithus tinctorius]KIN99294.1 hypothetical protein M404DRAFT_815609 [Pisolithus tinctorius Marx 270]
MTTCIRYHRVNVALVPVPIMGIPGTAGLQLYWLRGLTAFRCSGIIYAPIWCRMGNLSRCKQFAYHWETSASVYFCKYHVNIFEHGRCHAVLSPYGQIAWVGVFGV